MSIFDKFTQKNQYVKTYAGAPIQEAMAVTSQLNQRAAANIGQMDKTQATVSAAPAIGEADRAYKNLIAQQVQEDLNGIMEAPEHATMKVRQAAQKYQNDPGLRLAAANAAKHAKFAEQYEKDPSKYGDIPTWKLAKEMQRYEAEGGAAAGAVLSMPALYEQIDDNEWMRNNGEDIAASTKGVSWNGKDGFIYENTKEQLSKAEVANILGGAVYGDKDLMRQYNDEHAMAQEMGFKGSFENFVAAKIDPYSSMFSYEKNITKMKGAGQGSGKSKSGSYNYNPNAMTYGGKSVPITVAAKTESGVDLLNQLYDLKSSTTKEGQDTYQKLRAGYDRAIDAVGDKENLDPKAIEFMKTMTPMMFDGVRGAHSDVQTGDVVDGTTMNVTGKGTVFNESRTNIKSGLMEKYGSTITAEQAETYAKQINRAMTGSFWQTDVEDVFAEANTLHMDTEMVIVSDALGLSATEEKRFNSAMQGNLGALDVVTMFGEDGAVELDGQELREMYETATAKVHSMDKNGTGVTVITMDNKEGETENVYLKLNPERNSIYRDMATMYTNQANDPNLPMNQRLNATASALNVMHDTIAASAEVVQKSGQRQALNFGALNTPIASRFGPIFMDRDENGDYNITDNNNTNLFENSPEYINMLAEADNPHAVAALVVNYCRQKLTVR